jgi:hypothetical protein
MLKTQYIKTEYRDIAKMLVKALPVENNDFGLKVEEYTAIIKSLSSEAKAALKCAHIFSTKASKEERQDLAQFRILVRTYYRFTFGFVTECVSGSYEHERFIYTPEIDWAV